MQILETTIAPVDELEERQYQRNKSNHRISQVVSRRTNGEKKKIILKRTEKQRNMEVEPLLMKCHINGIEAIINIDCGAEFSTISHDFFPKTGFTQCH